MVVSPAEDSPEPMAAPSLPCAYTSAFPEMSILVAPEEFLPPPMPAPPPTPCALMVPPEMLMVVA